jgi:hypothetical protein
MAAAKKKPAAKTPAPKRTDAAGRSGMGESAMSNIKRNAFGRSGSATPADRAASEAGRKSNPTKTSIGLTKAYNTSMSNAEKYAYKRQQEMNPRRDTGAYGPGSGNAGFGKKVSSASAPTRKATGKAISASSPFRPKKKK